MTDRDIIIVNESLNWWGADRELLAAMERPAISRSSTLTALPSVIGGRVWTS
jgi:hypothetical protein